MKITEASPKRNEQETARQIRRLTQKLVNRTIANQNSLSHEESSSAVHFNQGFRSVMYDDYVSTYGDKKLHLVHNHDNTNTYNDIALPRRLDRSITIRTQDTTTEATVVTDGILQVRGEQRIYQRPREDASPLAPFKETGGTTRELNLLESRKIAATVLGQMRDELARSDEVVTEKAQDSSKIFANP